MQRAGLLAVVCALFAGTACGGDDPPPGPTPVPVEETLPPEVELVTGAPTMVEDGPEATSYSTLGYVVALDALGTTTVVGTTVEASTVGQDALETLEIVGDGPITTGRVQAVLRRNGNVLVAADNGLFHTLESKLVLSPASETLSALDIRSLHLASATTNEQIWIVAADGLYQLEDDELSKWTIDGTNPADITALLVSGQEATIAFGGSVYMLDLGEMLATRIDYDFGTINALVVGPGGVLQIATSEGLYERVAENQYVHYTLADGDAVAEVDDLVLDPKQGTFAVTAAGVLLASGGATPTGAAELPEQTAPRVMAFDDIGNLWIGDDETVYGLKLGTPISFELDVRPILEQYCMGCHGTPPAENTPEVSFIDYDTAVEYATAIVLRVGTGQMPPLGSEAVPPEDFELIKRWHEGGDNP